MQMKPAELLREFRLNEAILLAKEGESINNIAMSVGFSTHSSFSRCFKLRFGVSPSKYFNSLL
ncbi:MAG: hypothetical protein COA74_01485 [Gammaproteobacteria bacterium]|nr:MAG: hypothetical protein COA74_01485 [Gammaproteobacteria bacterium]